jgi:branched-chain amino acid transport system permease protein
VASSLRIEGLCLAIATLAGQLIIEWTINHVTFISGGVQASIEVARLPDRLDGSQQPPRHLLLSAGLRGAGHRGDAELMRSRVGRAFIAIRDQDIAAEIIGINIFATSCWPSRCPHSTPA